MIKRFGKKMILIPLAFLLFVGILAFTPHHTCACGEYEDSSQLTHLINSASEKLIGKPIIRKNESPFGRRVE